MRSIMLGEAKSMRGDISTGLPQDFIRIDPEVTAKLVTDLKKDYGGSAPLHKEVVEETGKFLYVCATYPRDSFRPSLLVDYGWHAFILRTQSYADHCGRLGTFVHHTPDEEHVDSRLASAQVVGTFEVIRDLGLNPNEEVWDMEHWLSRCSSCGSP